LPKAADESGPVAAAAAPSTLCEGGVTAASESRISRTGEGITASGRWLTLSAGVSTSGSKDAWISGGSQAMFSESLAGSPEPAGGGDEVEGFNLLEVTLLMKRS
jgi:hypothetical protein